MHAKTKSRNADCKEGVGGPTLKSAWAAKYLFFLDEFPKLKYYFHNQEIILETLEEVED